MSRNHVRGWGLVLAFYVALGGISGVAFLIPGLDTREGRWGLGLALANLVLVLSGVIITLAGFRHARRWAWWIVLATGLLYGIPMTVVDHAQVGWMGPVSVLELALIAIWAAGLLLPFRSFWGKGLTSASRLAESGRPD